ncbi:MAG TPA: YdeI/OmpD-associated family protein [Gemmatimonadaceae bacterium]|nr:YdeI/OmpD-associated family protein [Gemmatimonadaceae bacterium]
MKKKKAVTGSAPGAIRGFKTRKDFATWLEKNHKTTPALWVRIARKGSGVKSITYAQGVEVALCYGWIDAQKLPESETAWLQRFMPRRPRSIWSKVNREKALALIASGQMTPAGLMEIERAKKDGRWEAAYDSQSGASVPPDFEKELERHPIAKSFFKTLSRANTYAILWRLETAKKPETRSKRMRSFIEMLEKGETLH